MKNENSQDHYIGRLQHLCWDPSVCGGLGLCGYHNKHGDVPTTYVSGSALQMGHLVFLVGLQGNELVGSTVIPL